MAKKNKAQKEAKKLQQELQESAHKIWLAGLGALSAAGEGSTRLFQQLVNKGEDVENQGKQAVESQVTQAKSRVEGTVKDAKTRVESTVDEMLKGIDERVTQALHDFGVPTRDEIQTLTSRVEELNRKVDTLKSRPATPATTPAAASNGARKVYHVTVHDEGWKVEAEGATRATSVHGTKNEAVSAAKELAQNQRPSQVVIHKQDGSFQTEHTYDELTN
jgi:poly(hydroxyalkanoate) granule-associated protein